MKLAILIFSALSASILIAIAGFQLARLFILEISDFVAEAWHSPEMHWNYAR